MYNNKHLFVLNKQTFPFKGTPLRQKRFGNALRDKS